MLCTAVGPGFLPDGLVSQVPEVASGVTREDGDPAGQHGQHNEGDDRTTGNVNTAVFAVIFLFSYECYFRTGMGWWFFTLEMLMLNSSPASSTSNTSYMYPAMMEMLAPDWGCSRVHWRCTGAYAVVFRGLA